MNPKQPSDFNSDPAFLRATVNAITQALCVIDENLEVVFYNEAFSQIFGKQKDVLFGKRFGKSIGCRGHEQSYPDGICNSCKLRLAMMATIATGQNQEKESMVLEMEKGSKEDVRLIQYESTYMEHKGDKYAVVFIYDLTSMGKKTLEFINKFYAV